MLQAATKSTQICKSSQVYLWTRLKVTYIVVLRDLHYLEMIYYGQHLMKYFIILALMAIRWYSEVRSGI